MVASGLSFFREQFSCCLPVYICLSVCHENGLPPGDFYFHHFFPHFHIFDCFTERFLDLLIYCLIQPFTTWRIHWSTDWLIDCLIDWLINWLIAWLIVIDWAMNLWFICLLSDGGCLLQLWRLKKFFKIFTFRLSTWRRGASGLCQFLIYCVSETSEFI